MGYFAAIAPALLQAAAAEVAQVRAQVLRDIDALTAQVADRHTACSTRVPWLVSIGGQMYRWAPTMPNRANPFSERRRGAQAPAPIEKDRATALVR